MATEIQALIVDSAAIDPATATETIAFYDENGQPLDFGSGSIFNVKAYGAIGNGITDDTAAVQAAINASAAVNGGVCFFPPGVYVVSGLTVTSGVTIQGVNSQNFYSVDNVPNMNTCSMLKLKAASTSPILSPVNDAAWQVNVFDMAFDGNGIALGSSGTKATCINLPDAGSPQGRFWNITRCYFTHCGGTGSDNSCAVYVGNMNMACLMRDCYLLNSMASSTGTDGVVWYGSDGIMDNVWIAKFARTGLGYSGGANDLDLYVNGGAVYWCSTGISVGGGGLVLNNVSIDHNYNDGIYVNNGPITIIGCTFHTNSITTNNTWSHINLANDNLVATVIGCRVQTDDGEAGGKFAAYFIQVGSHTGITLNAYGNIWEPSGTLSSGWTNYLNNGPVTTTPMNFISNTRIRKRVLVTNAPGATPSMNTNNYESFRFTGLGTAITSMTTNCTGTPNDGDTLTIMLTDDGTGRAITWGAKFEASTVALPTTTVSGALLTVGFVWNVATTKWRCVAAA